MNNAIEPFQWFCMKDGSVSVDLSAGVYQKDFFQKYAEDFENEDGNGYDWELFVERYIRKCFPEMMEHINFDSESEMFCIYSKQKELLQKFAGALKRVTDDLSTMENVWLEVRKHYNVYAAMEFTSSEKMVLSYVGVTTLSLEDRLKQHQMNGKNFIKLFLIDTFMVSDEAKGYEEVIEEIMTNPTLNKGYLFTNQNNSLHPYGDKELYEIATTWAIGNMRNKNYMSKEGKLSVLDTFYEKIEEFNVLELANANIHGLHKKNCTDNFEEDLSPFYIMKLENGMLSACLDTSTYKKEVFAKRNNEGIMGSGYDWEKAASILRHELGLDLFGEVYFDSEADLFCVYSNDTEKFMEFISKLKALCENDMKLEAVISKI